VIVPISTPISITLATDAVGMIFSSVVLLISANVLTFSKIYMEEEKFKNRFTILVLLFILSINLLIFIPHFMVLLLG
jgi:NADH:ubiquinone oxidoreductase subunit 5 (subunit L)/multisubunit Na+/H+ antiporter MnhA subunit